MATGFLVDVLSGLWATFHAGWSLRTLLVVSLQFAVRFAVVCLRQAFA